MLKKTFTLIELLVVIAIIAILAAMLLPALSKARMKAKCIGCVNNEKHILFAMIQYGDDFGGYLLPANADNNSDDYRCMCGSEGLSSDSDLKKLTYPYFLCPYLGLTQKVPANKGIVHEEDDYYTFFGNDVRGVFCCPASSAAVRTYYYSHYGIPEYFIGGRGGYDKLRYFNITQPSSVCHIGDSVYPTENRAYGFGTYNTDETPSKSGITEICNDGRFWSLIRHGERANAGMVDGHVETLTRDNLRGLVAGGYWNGVFLGTKGIQSGDYKR